MHLWEVEHAYYCSEAEHNKTCNSWEQFIANYGDMDMDYNLIFRWDWLARDPDEECSTHVLRLFWVMQRKGYLTSCTVYVEPQDEPRVMEWLKPRMRHLFSLWQPLENS